MKHLHQFSRKTRRWQDVRLPKDYPQPFAGAAPTRIRWEIRSVSRADIENMRPGKLIERYVGIPNSMTMRRFRKLILGSRENLNFWISEFDRASQIQVTKAIHARWFGQREQLERVLQQPTGISPLAALYHPWDQPGFQLWDSKQWVKGIRVGKDKFFMVYSPLEKLKLQTHVRPYKQWAQGVFGAEKEAKKATLPQRGLHVQGLVDLYNGRDEAQVLRRVVQAHDELRFGELPDEGVD